MKKTMTEFRNFWQKRIFFLFIIIIIAVLETTILEYFKMFDVSPDLLLMAAVMASIFFEMNWALFFSAFCGLLKDSLSVNVFGINAVLFAVWGFLIIELAKKITIDNIIIYTVIVFIVTMLNNIVIRFVFLFLGNFIPLGIFLRITFLESFYTALALPLIFKAFDKRINLLIDKPI